MHINMCSCCVDIVCLVVSDYFCVLIKLKSKSICISTCVHVVLTLFVWLFLIISLGFFKLKSMSVCITACVHVVLTLFVIVSVFVSN